MKKNISLIIILLISVNLHCQNYNLIRENCKKIDYKTFDSLKKIVPTIKINSIFENGKEYTKKSHDSLLKNYQIHKFKYIFLKDTVKNELVAICKERSKEELKNSYKKQNKSNQIKDKKIRENLNNSIIDKLELLDMNNYLHNLESLKGKIIVLNFWFTECKPCVSEIPNLNKLKQKFNPENVAFFAVTFDDKETINNFILKHQLDYTIIPNGRKITNQFKIPYYPFNIIIDQNGKIEYINNSFSFNILKKVETKIKNKLK